MNTNLVITSYKENFSSVVGAYCYLLLNQQFPEIFVIRSNQKTSELNTQLENIFKSENSLEDIIRNIKTIDKKHFEAIESSEQLINQETVLSLLENVQHLNIENDWNMLEGIIEYNNYSIYINDNAVLIEKMKNLAEKFSMNSVSVNPNYHVEEFINTMHIELDKMCKLLEIQPSHIGLNTLNLNYQTEEGDFSGYVQPGEEGVSDKMVIKKRQVFLHEWIHFIDSSLGNYNYNITDLLKVDVGNEVLTINGLAETAKFDKKLYTNIEEYSSKDFSTAINSLGYFLEKYALQKDIFYTQLETISNSFIEQVSESKNNAQENMINEIISLLSPNFPNRYLSFMKAQCEIHIDKTQQKLLENNQLVAFSKKADNHLGEADYTVSIIETFARTAECYFFDKGKEEGISLKLLANNYDSDFSPQGKLREEMNSHWEKSWCEIKHKLYNLNKPKNIVLSNIEKLRIKNKTTTNKIAYN